MSLEVFSKKKLSSKEVDLYTRTKDSNTLKYTGMWVAVNALSLFQKIENSRSEMKKTGTKSLHTSLKDSNSVLSQGHF